MEEVKIVNHNRDRKDIQLEIMQVVLMAVDLHPFQMRTTTEVEVEALQTLEEVVTH